MLYHCDTGICKVLVEGRILTGQAIAQGRRQKTEGRRQKAEGSKLRKSRVSTIKNVLITLAVAIKYPIPVDSTSLLLRVV